MKSEFLIFLVLLIYIPLKATEQIPDYLIYKGETVEIYSNPLEEIIVTAYRDTSFFINTCMSTACWRGYQATWKIENEKLFLLKIEDGCGEKVGADMKLIFEEKWINNKVEANWYSGEIVIPFGEEIYGEHMGYSTVHEYEEIIIFENGKILSKNKIDNTKTKLPYFNSDNLSIHLIKNLDRQIIQEIWDKEFVIDLYGDIEGNEKRQVTKVEFNRKNQIKYEEKIKEIIFKINDWNILYRHGEKAKLPWLYPIKIDKKKLRKNKKFWQ